MSESKPPNASDQTTPAFAFHVDKMHAAHRQLNVAIRLHFEDDDPVAVVTLAGAAATIFSDLVELQNPSKSWDRHAQNVMKLAPRDYFRIVREAQNFLKHARDDPDAVFHWTSSDIEALIMNAVMNAGELDGLSISSSVFQLWYIAKNSKIFTAADRVLEQAASFFPRLDALPPEAQLARGLTTLLSQLERARKE